MSKNVRVSSGSQHSRPCLRHPLGLLLLLPVDLVRRLQEGGEDDSPEDAAVSVLDVVHERSGVRVHGGILGRLEPGEPLDKPRDEPPEGGGDYDGLHAARRAGAAALAGTAVGSAEVALVAGAQVGGRLGSLAAAAYKRKKLISKAFGAAGYIYGI